MRSVGDHFENRAVELLRANGLRVLERNFSRKTGEIDIIALDGNCLVFFEVRWRSHRGYASAAASVDRRKQQRIMRTAQLYLQTRSCWANMPCRFDVIAFEPRQSETGKTTNWIRAAFTA